jgi:hypothetical protein
MRWILIAVAAVVVLIIAVVVIGYLLPIRHVASRSLTVHAPVDRVWRALVGVEAFPSWRKGLRSVERSESAALTWKEVDTHGEAIAFAAEEMVPNRRLITRIVDRGLPFGGSWTYELEPSGDGTRITITENGEVYNPVFRFVSRFVMGHTATIDTYLSSLQPYVERQ